MEILPPVLAGSTVAPWPGGGHGSPEPPITLDLGVKGLIPTSGTGMGQGFGDPSPGRVGDMALMGVLTGAQLFSRGFHNCIAAAGRDRAESGQPVPAPTMTWSIFGMGKTGTVVGRGRLSYELPIPSQTPALLAKVRRELSSASVSLACEWWHPGAGWLQAPQPEQNCVR